MKLALPPTWPVSVLTVASPAASAVAIAGYEILPAHAPLPTACSLVFQPAAGSQTSILMSESLEGVSVAATRQNDGRFAKAFPPRPVRPAGSVNCPAPTVCASVTATCGCEKDERLSHGAPTAGAAARRNARASFIHGQA